MLNSIYDVANFDELTDELIELFKEFDKELNSYDTDVYLYYDEDTNTATLDTFVNPGGNSWLNDDHYTIYTDKQHYDSFIDWYGGETSVISDVLNMSEEQLYQETANYFNIDDIDNVYYYDIEKYVTNNESYNNILYDNYCRYIDNDYESEYADRADLVWECFENDLDYYR